MKKHSKSAFTLIELIVVIAVLAIITSIAIPFFSNYRSDASEVVCTQNRGMLLRNYQIHLIDYASDSFDDFFNAYFSDQEMCPDGGQYHYDQGSLTCSYHSNSVDGPGDVPEGTLIFPGGYSTQTTVSWDEMILEASQGYGGEVLLPDGTVLYHGDDFYVWMQNNPLHMDDVIDGHPNLLRILNNRLIFPEDFSSGVDVKKGSVKYENEDYYVWIAEDENDVDENHWVFKWGAANWKKIVAP